MPDMNSTGSYALLILNAGSSSIKFGIYQDTSLTPLATGQLRDLNTSHSHFTFTDHTPSASAATSANWDGPQAIPQLVIWLKQWAAQRQLSLVAVAHRIVSAMGHTAPVIISAEILAEIEAGGSTDPEHASVTLDLIRACLQQFESIPQVALFDSAFHAMLPDRARMLPVPKLYRDMGVRRYGFHGLSYTSIMAQVMTIYGQKLHDSKVIIAHLGNGSSLAAVQGGVSRDTTMSFSPTGGIPMSTRSGDLDPAAVLYILEQNAGDTKKLTNILNNESGLKAISGTTGDISALLKMEENDVRAKAAVEYFCYHVRKAIGGYAAALGGIDVLIFTGGIGEHLSAVRAGICGGLGYMGIRLDEKRNANNERELSADGQHPLVLMLPSQEEAAMAQLLRNFIRDQMK